jgi:hypothetical protein
LDFSDNQSTQSPDGSFESFQSFQDWLATFAAGGEKASNPDIEENLAALRLAKSRASNQSG